MQGAVVVTSVARAPQKGGGMVLLGRCLRTLMVRLGGGKG